MHSNDSTNTHTASVCVATVSYGDRWQMAKECVESSLAAGADYVVIVDNGLTESSREQLLQNVSDSRVRITEPQGNQGSSYGFSVALEQACGLSEYVLLLDDDNIPQADCIAGLLDASAKYPGSILFAIRPAGDVGAMRLKGMDILPIPGSFLGFDLIRRVCGPKSVNVLPDGNIRISMGPWGGLFASCSTIQTLGYPSRQWGTYGDDYCYTYRAFLRGIELISIVDATVNEQEPHWQQETEVASSSSARYLTCDDNRVTDSFIGSVRFSYYQAHETPSLLRYRLNQLIYLAHMALSSLRTHRIQRFIELVSFIPQIEKQTLTKSRTILLKYPQ